MCTVSFIPLGKKVFITSNRDVKNWRLPAKAPMHYSYDNGKMVFPKDSNAGGSWICVCDNSNAGVLLNGAFTNHKKNETYLKSRGLIFLEIMNAQAPLQKFLTLSLYGIEPFTLILWLQNNLYECRWDDTGTKHCKHLHANRAYIWSSATLYDGEARKKREKWFGEWINKHPDPSMHELFWFIRSAGDDDKKDSLLRNRNGNVFTVSITILELATNRGTMNYTDFITGNTTEKKLSYNMLTA
jgi:hypothetical protein